MQQLSIFDVFNDFEKNSRILDVLAKAKEFDSSLDIFAVYIPSLDMSKALCSFAVKGPEGYRHFRVRGSGAVEETTNSLLMALPLNKYWIVL